MTISLLCSQEAYLWWSFMAKDPYLQPFTVRISSTKEISSVWLIFCPHQGFIRWVWHLTVLTCALWIPILDTCGVLRMQMLKVGWERLYKQWRGPEWDFEGRRVHLQSHPRDEENGGQAGIMGGSRFRLTEWRQVRGKQARHADVCLKFQLQETEAWESWDKGYTLGYIVSYKLA